MRRVFLDTNVIIEAFRISAWSELSQGYHLETVQECEKEALTGDTDIHGRVVVDAGGLRAGLKGIHLIQRKERNALIGAHPTCSTMDPGERDLFAYLFTNCHPLPPLIVLSSADKGVIVRAGELGWLDQLVSLEELLDSCGIARTKLNKLDRPHRASFLRDVRTKVRMGVIP